MPVNFLFYRGFISIFVFYRMKEASLSRDIRPALGHLCTQIQMLWFRSKYTWAKYAWDLAFTNKKWRLIFLLNTLLFTSLIFNFSNYCFTSPNPWVNLVVSSACGVNTSDSGAPSLVFSQSWTTIVRRRKKISLTERLKHKMHDKLYLYGRR